MPKVSVGLFTEKNRRFIRNVKSGLVKNGKESKDLTIRTGRCVKTVYNKYKEPEKLTVTELRAYIKEASLPEQEVLDFLYEGKYV